MNRTLTAAPATDKHCSECGEHNPSWRKSTVCNRCKYLGYPHTFVKPSAALKGKRFNLSAINCHCEHEHERCTDECPPSDCRRIGADLGACAVCVRSDGDAIHTGKQS